MDTPNVKPADAVMPGLLKLNPDVLELPKPALRLPEGLFVVPNPNVEAPVVLHPKPELAPKPSGGDRETHGGKTQVKDTDKPHQQ